MQTEEPTLHDMDNYIQTRFKNAIEYYWAASRSNKHWYKTTRSLTIIFGALVTLVATILFIAVAPDISYIGSGLLHVTSTDSLNSFHCVTLLTLVLR